MKNVIFSLNKEIKNKNAKEKIILTYHDEVKGNKEYYTYIDDNGKESVFDTNTYNILKISSSLLVASKNKIEKIPIEFIPSKDTIEYQKEYFTYKDNNQDKVFLGKVMQEDNSYFGIKEYPIILKENIILYKEED